MCWNERQDRKAEMGVCTGFTAGNLSCRVGGWRLFRWHRHGHFISRQDVLRRGLKTRIDSNFRSVPVVYVLIAVPHAVDQVSLEDDENGDEDEHEEQQTAGVQREQVVFVGKVGQLVQVVLDSGQVCQGADSH